MAFGAKTYQAYSAVIEALKACTPHSCREYVLQRPNHQESPTDSNEFIANEHFLLSYHCNEKIVEEAMSSDMVEEASGFVWGLVIFPLTSPIL